MSYGWHKAFGSGGVDTTSGNALAEHIQEGKKAWVDGVEITGTKAANSGILLEVVAPTGVSDASFSPATEHGAVIICDPDFAPVGGAGTWVLGTNGFASNATGFAAFVNKTGSVPAYSGKRKYELWGRVADVALTHDEGVRIIFNRTNGSYTDYWAVSLIWDTAAGGYFNVIVAEVTSSVGTVRANSAFTTALDLPAEFHLVVYEQGDAVIAQCVMFETDNITDDEAVSCAYTVGSRPHKTSTSFDFGLTNDPETDWLIRGCRISDIG